MSTRKRIVVYGAASHAGDDEVLDAIVAATGLDREALATQLARNPAVYLPEVEEEAATELTAFLDRRGIDHDVEPFPPPPEHVEWLEGEIPKWVRRGFLPAYARPSLYWNYGLTPPAAAVDRPARPGVTTRDPSFLVKAVLTIGAILVGLGLILFIASNWQRIPPSAKIGGALVLTLAALHVGYQLRFVRGPYPKLGATFLLIALFGVGGVLTLIAQIYHLVAGTYLLPLVWGALCVPMAFALRFQTALYFGSALWLWSYWLYPIDHERLPWYYAVLLLGFLLPYAIAAGDRFLYWTHVALVLVALISTPVTEDFWLATVWIAALAALAGRDRRPIYDWILSVGFFFWAVVFFQWDDDLPNIFYAVPLVYFLYRAVRRKDDGFLVVTVANALVWWLVFLLQLIARFDLGEPSATAVLLWALGTGVLVYGIGSRMAAADWRIASTLLRAGGAALAFVVVYAMSFRFYEREREFFESPLLLFVTLASFVVGAVLLWRGPGEAPPPRRDELLVVALLALGLGLAVAFSPGLGAHVVLFNLILFATALLLMLEGHRAQSLLWYNLGIGLFVVLITSRYFDTFVDLLPRSVFFLLGGIFLIVWAVLVDRQRRRRAALAASRGEEAGA